MRRSSRIVRLFPVVMLLALAGFPQPVACAADSTPPTGTIVINNNRSATNTPNVKLTLTWDDGTDGSGVTRMRFSDDGSHWTLWEPLAATRAHALPGGDGHKTVRVQFLDRVSNRSAVYSDYILLDTTPPTGGIVISGGAASSFTQLTALGVTWSDESGAGVSRMRFSDNGSTWSTWETPRSACTHALSSGLGYHTVRVQFLDGAGNYSAVFNDYIKLVDVKSGGTTETLALTGDVPLIMTWIPGCTFLMGRYQNEQDSLSNEDPQHDVSVAGFWMGKYELTQRQWTTVMGSTPWAGRPHVLANPEAPASYVSWNDTQAFIAAVNGLAGRNALCLPSEAEWECACRARTTTRFYWGDDPNYTAIDDYAWWDVSTLSSGEYYPHPVGQKLPNAFGLYDMIGNVAEWCEDDWHPDYSGAPTGGQAWVDTPRATNRVARGGFFLDFSPSIHNCYWRTAFRYNLPPSPLLPGDYGLRVVCR